MRSRLVPFLPCFLLFSCITGPRVYSPPRKMVVLANVANIRAKPVPHNGTYEYDALQETQVLKGDPVLVHEIRDGWARVEVPDQLEYTHHSKWEGYPGWVSLEALTKDLSKHHSIKRSNLSQEKLRELILSQASRHLGNAYLWGGRSLHSTGEKSVVTGVDCSGLINWSFREVGWFVPRDVHEQYMRARPVHPKDLKPGDLIFLAKKDKPGKIVHVAFYAGKGRLLEAPYTGEKVQENSFEKRFGVSLDQMKNGMMAGDAIVRFGTFFNE